MMSRSRIFSFYLSVVAAWALTPSAVVYSSNFDEEYLTNFNTVLIQHRSLVLEQMASEEWCSQTGTGEWIDVTGDRPVCFGARNNMFGTFQLPAEGFLAGLKLVHARGHVTCDKRARGSYSKWGCWTAHGKGAMNVIVTTHRDRVLFPQQRFVTDNSTMWYEMPGCDPNSPEVNFQNKFNPTYVTSGQKLRLWYGEDLTSKDEIGNSGKTCTHVFAWYM